MAVPKRSRATESTDAGARDKPREEKSGGGRMLRKLGLGLITGAADDDPSAIGTYASAGAAVGPAFLWTAPVTFPMMCAVVYLSAKLGQVSGKGFFHVIRDHYSRWIRTSEKVRPGRNSPTRELMLFPACSFQTW